ncbi:SF1B family DNA helicase RecD2 [Anaerococcus hydrogenalis]|uniref:ATP-dependent RecD2 DNA helicase n=1 Tax=Anaerococcus hydrogenalis TaxID=33029 RepID=A0A2N6UJL8_9FIRM|nr:ATP-dependent RecD-like DNA helicase [Anaerococcus hydrogenalis]MDK7695135.1 ATP-dependent RecD-like DNA helicase [Anaerococcus hydrogenalis]MDK7696890.1 ATP-dependent RecD-like DNA helicase [Anaerococcus hydrogenalis]MDK7708162.1 ATP-dependent RecD-like DNA helicase [Anaerococcus hydrogenalis]PMC81886.1 ATP-dependent RecD-like DNA helicase [Anaerococcus hydrogenalis]
MKFEGIIKSIIYRNEENGYTVLSLETSDSPITCTGIMPFLNENDQIIVEGELIYHDKYGEQIQVESASLKKPSGKKAIISYLSSGNIESIGKKTAQLIYEKFKDDSIDVVFNQSEKLLTIPGIGKKKLEKIKESTLDARDSREALLYLQGLNISFNLANKIYKAYGDNTISIVKTNPYKLSEDISGIGFIMADNIAINMQMKSDSKFRISAAISYVLKNDAEMTGSCTIRLDDLIDKTFSLIKVDRNKIKDQINEDLINSKIQIMKIGNEEFVYDKDIYKAEKSTAINLSRLKNEKYIFDLEINEDLDVFSKQQQVAINEAFNNMLLVITGGPGTGKTTIIKAICNILDDNNLKFNLAAPTGRAAKRMQESTENSALTIHRLIGIKPESPIPEYNEENPLECDYVIVDEVSMVDIKLMDKLLKALSSNTALILVGDHNQLPSVGPGNVLKDILDTDIKSVRLNKIFRQAQESNIVVNAHRINDGLYPILNQKNKDFFFIDSNANNFQKDILDLIKNRLPNYYKLDPINDIQILAPSKKSSWGVLNLNNILQENLNKNPKSFKINNRIFKLKDKVMQVRNNYDLESLDPSNFDDGVYNGDIGRIIELDEERESLKIEFYDGNIVSYKKEDIKDLDLSYAITIHKSQGSEFDCVVIPMMPTSFMLLNRNLLYTAITRAKKLVILIGEKRILKQMVRNNKTSQRLTNLSFWIKELSEALK